MSLDPEFVRQNLSRLPQVPLEVCPCCRQAYPCTPHPSGREAWVCTGCGFERFGGVTWRVQGDLTVGYYYPATGACVSHWAARPFMLAGDSFPSAHPWFAAQGPGMFLTESRLPELPQPVLCALTGQPITPVTR